ncbi:MAG: hypothetical protein Q9M23_07240 [Mariprofundaceae bacterium]|nr:hypothetical protein [Mariprofundaceae bacterium]
MKRIGRDSFIRNCCIAAGNSDQSGLQSHLWPLASNDVSAIVRGHAVWALGELSRPKHATGVLRPDIQVQLTALLASEQDDDVREEISLTINDIKERL